MDREAAFRYITDYWALVDKAHKLPLFSRERRAAVKAANGLAGVNRILRELAPDLPVISAHGIGDHVGAWPHIRRALDLITAGQEMDAYGQAAGPGLPLRLLDPVVSKVALPLWEARMYRQAVSDAATSLNRFAQDRIGRHDISDKDLMGQVFSDKEPEEGKARLLCPGNPASETVRSQQEGARAFAIGTFQAIRNPAHHLTGDWNPVTAFHHLAALSQVAHWFREWNVVRYVPPPPDLSAIKVDAGRSPVLMQAVRVRLEVNRQPTGPSGRGTASLRGGG
jgi:hypothetical protein